MAQALTVCIASPELVEGARPLVVGAAQGLAIHGNHLSLGEPLDAAHPSHETFPVKQSRKRSRSMQANTRAKVSERVMPLGNS